VSIGTGGGAVEDVMTRIASPAMRALIEAFADNERERVLARDLESGRWPSADLLKELDSFSDRWDTRQGRERHLAVPLNLTTEQEQLALAVAEDLGMCAGAQGTGRRYDHLLILGGTVGGCLFRTASAAHLTKSRQVTANSVVALGGYRRFSGDEFALAEAVGAPDLDEEYAALDYGTRVAFGLDEPVAVEGEGTPPSAGAWSVRHYRHGNSEIRVAAAPSREPAERRANTADTYAFFAKRLATLQPGERILIVTSCINVPSQHATALRMLALPYGAEVDTVGHVPEIISPVLAETESAAKYLLEVRSFIRSLRKLGAALR